MKNATDHRGYVIGPTLEATERPWPIDWESNPYRDEFGNECTHDVWELVLLAADGRHRVRVEECVRCQECLAPRCGHSTDEDPCILERHHRFDHMTQSEFDRQMVRLDNRILPMIELWKRARA